MEFEDLPKNLQETVRCLKHGSTTIQADIEDALDEAEDLKHFKELARAKIECLIDECNSVIVEIFGPPEPIKLDPPEGYVKHIIKEGARFHVISWDGYGEQCSESNCEINYWREKRIKEMKNKPPEYPPVTVTL